MSCAWEKRAPRVRVVLLPYFEAAEDFSSFLAWLDEMIDGNKLSRSTGQKRMRCADALGDQNDSRIRALYKKPAVRRMQIVLFQHTVSCD